MDELSKFLSFQKVFSDADRGSLLGRSTLRANNSFSRRTISPNVREELRPEVPSIWWPSVHLLDHCCSAVESPVVVVAVAFSSRAAQQTWSPPGSLLVSNASSLSLALHVLSSVSLTPRHAQEEQKTWAN